MKQFTKADAKRVAARERKVVDGVVCPDFDGSLSFTVKEPSARDLLKLVKLGEEYGQGGASIAMVAACVIGPDEQPVFTFEEAAEFVLGNVGTLEPLFEAINEVGVSAVEEATEGDVPLD